MKEMTDLLEKSRKQRGVVQENKYFFGIPGTLESLFRTSDIIRRLRRQAKVAYEDRITTTAMRKEAVTLSAACGLSEQQLDLLANVLGHTNLVHRAHHRLPEATLEKAKAGKFLTTIANSQPNIQEPLVPNASSYEDSTSGSHMLPSTSTRLRNISDQLQEKVKSRNKRVISKPKRMWLKDEESLIKKN